MLAMEKYKNYLLIGVKFEKLNMKENAKKMYNYYLQKIVTIDYANVLEYFYGYSTIEVEDYEEAINKAYLIEKLKKLYKLIDSYRDNWIDSTNSSKIYDDTLISFFKWVQNNHNPSNTDLKIITDIIKMLESGVSFNIKVDQNFMCTLFDTIVYIRANQIQVNEHGNELI